MADTMQPATNPYAPPRAAVRDISMPYAATVLAERGTRLGAAILDSLIFMGMVYIPMIIATFAVAAIAPRNPGAMGFAFLVALAGFVVWLWMTIKNMQANGQSIAKKMLNIKVVRSDGSPVTVGRLILLRNVVNIILGIIPFYGLVDSLLIFGETRQCLHDKLADTIVIVA
jgi:uncharacterized RDD family membrane protein YckC